VTDALALVGGLTLAAIPAFLLPAAMRLRPWTAFVLAALVSAAGTLVLVIEALSLVHGLTRAGLLVGQLAAAILVCGSVAALGSARHGVSETLRSLPTWPGRRRLWSWVRAEPTITFMAFVALLTIGVNFVLATVVAPNNWDSMTYHLSRAAYWLQHHAVERYPGGTVRQLGSPPVAEMLQAWTLALTHGDHFAQLVQWLAGIGVGIGVFGMARLLGFTRSLSVFAACVFVVLPQPVMQASSTQNDLVLSFFLVATAYFGLSWLRDRSPAHLAFGAASLGLAFGTKGTAFPGTVALAVFLGLAAIRMRPPLRSLLPVGAAVAVSFLLLGSYVYVLNVRDTSSVFAGVTNLVQRQGTVPGNFVRVAWRFVDTPGMDAGWFDIPVQRVAHGFLQRAETPRFHYQINHAAQEDLASFGLAGLFLLIPVVVVTLMGRRRTLEKRALALAGIAYVVALSATVGWDVWQGRVLLPAVALTAPLLAVLGTRPGPRAVTAVVATVGLIPCLLFTPNKPVIQPANVATIFSRDRTHQQTIVNTALTDPLAAVEREVPTDAAIGVVGVEDTWDYPLFGPHLERRVERLAPVEATRAHMRADKLYAIYFDAVQPPDALHPQQIGAAQWLVRAPAG
jgi:Dolichyl-phosphate-mannose-protein mannosyltransferase